MQGGMPTRQFSDAHGVPWRVWSTKPASGATLSPDFKGGWLTFESAAELRRLAPIPPDWEDVSAARLDLMCRAARLVPRHTGPMPRVKREDLEEEQSRDHES